VTASHQAHEVVDEQRRATQAGRRRHERGDAEVELADFARQVLRPALAQQATA